MAELIGQIAQIGGEQVEPVRRGGRIARRTGGVGGTRADGA
ncbi:hypothetical protein ACFXA0_16910 [Streptomyces cyaneofuscatus]